MEKDFTGKATSRVCRVSYRTEDSARVIDLDVEFNWADVSTAHEKRDQRMREHFQKSGFDVIRGNARSVSMPMLTTAGSERPVTIPISMVMGGMTNQVHGLVTTPLQLTGEGNLLEMELKVSQAKFGYDPITLLGFMSVRDEVIAQVRFRMPPDPDSPNPIPER